MFHVLLLRSIALLIQHRIIAKEVLSFVFDSFVFYWVPCGDSTPGVPQEDT